MQTTRGREPRILSQERKARREWLTKWPLAEQLLAGVGVWRILPELRQATRAWASTRSVTPKVIALRYLADLWSHGYTMPELPP
jgi:hypothetical protein